ncbi:DUF4192 domain-containing protein [Nocardioides montaniterrae]
MTQLSVTARSPEDLLALAPVVLSFWPADDLVMLTFGGPRPFHARLDLPERASTQDLALLEATLLDPAVTHQVQSVVFLVYGERERIARAVCRALRAGARRRGIVVMVCLWARGGEFRFVGGEGRGVSEPFPYDVSAHPFVVQAIVEGRLSFRSRDEMVASLEPDHAACERVLAEIGSEEPGEEARQIMAVQTLDGRDGAMEMIRRSNAAAHRDRWARLLPCTPEPLVPAVADLLAFAAWQAGDGALAWAAIDRARRADPGDRMAGLLAGLLENAVPPDAWPA